MRIRIFILVMSFCISLNANAVQLEMALPEVEQIGNGIFAIVVSKESSTVVRTPRGQGQLEAIDGKEEQEILAQEQKQRQEREKQEASVREKKRQEEQEETKPKCMTIRFTGLASANNPDFIRQALAERNLEDTLARNPIRCQGFGCIGIAYFKNHKGQIISWDKNFYGITSPVDFNTGRRDIPLIVRRKDARCIN